MLLERFKRERFSILDIGANIGSSAYYFLKSQPHAYVLSFEPNNKLFPCLKQVQKLFPERMQLYPVGLGEVNANSRLYVPLSRNDYHSGLGSLHLDFTLKSYNILRGKKIFENLEGIDVVDVQINRGDLLDLPNDCRFVKIDVEGNEERCIIGMIDYLNRVKPIIVVEVIANNLKNVTQLLGENFIRVNVFDILKDIDLPNTFQYRNAVFVPRNPTWKTWLSQGVSLEI